MLNLNSVFTVQEVCDIYNLKADTIRKTLSKGSSKLIEGIDYRKSGGTWLLSKGALEYLGVVEKFTTPKGYPTRKEINTKELYSNLGGTLNISRSMDYDNNFFRMLKDKYKQENPIGLDEFKTINCYDELYFLNYNITGNRITEIYSFIEYYIFNVDMLSVELTYIADNTIHQLSKSYTLPFLDLLDSYIYRNKSSKIKIDLVEFCKLLRKYVRISSTEDREFSIFKTIVGLEY